MSTILVTGAAGFIGFHVAKHLALQGRRVVGIDNLNDYYDVSLKQARLDALAGLDGFSFVRADLADRAQLDRLFDAHEFSAVVNLAAQAGVRYSLVNPQAYVRSNIEGFVNLLEACRQHRIGHLAYASSSSVYGAVTKMPFSVHQNVDHPISLYAASKKANELMAHSYSHLFALPTTGMRFFTVYGPWGRPDMALFLFTRAILAGEPIKVFNNGDMERDFTYVDDVVDAVARLVERVPAPNPAWSGDDPDPGSSRAPYRLYNIGNHRPVKLLHLIELLEQCLGRKAEKLLLPMQPGDVPATYADIADLARDVGFAPRTPIEVGVERFVRWYRDYYRV
jgi:UDP-glucuronate 4-epimerase